MEHVRLPILLNTEERDISIMPKYKLDWKMKVLFWLMSRGPSIVGTDLQKMRSGSNSKMLSNLLFRPVRIADIEDRSIPGRHGTIPVRMYRPIQAANVPVVVFFHGGGWVLGGLDGHDAICRRVAVENGALVVSVDYRLAPEHPYPAAVEDAYDATCWVAEHTTDLGASPNKVIVMGDSAGGNLAAVVSLMARELARPQIAFQVLMYPAVDMGEDFPSKQRYDDTPVLSRQAMDYFRDLYIQQPADLKDPHVSPLLADDLNNLPPALILTAEYDPLSDEGKAYADRLRASGNDVLFVCYRGMVHGFISFGWLGSRTKAAFAQIKQTLQQVQ
jgi:acetyl esterase